MYFQNSVFVFVAPLFFENLAYRIHPVQTDRYNKTINFRAQTKIAVAPWQEGAAFLDSSLSDNFLRQKRRQERNFHLEMDPFHNFMHACA